MMEGRTCAPCSRRCDHHAPRQREAARRRRPAPGYVLGVPAPRYRGNAKDYLASLRLLRSLPVPDLVLPGHPAPTRHPRARSCRNDDGRTCSTAASARWRPSWPAMKRMEKTSWMAFPSTSCPTSITWASSRASPSTACSPGPALPRRPEWDRSRRVRGEPPSPAWPEAGGTHRGLAPGGRCEDPLGRGAGGPRRHRDPTHPAERTRLLADGLSARVGRETSVVLRADPVKITPESVAALVSDIGTSKARLQEYADSIKALRGLSPQLWLPATPIEGQNANLYDDDWERVLDANRDVTRFALSRVRLN